MGKFAVLLVLAGLAVGLWLGFNPAAHKEIVHLWTNASVSQKRSSTPAVFSIRQIDAQVTRWFRSAPKPQHTTASQPSTQSVWTQIRAVFQDLWNALQRIWLSIQAKLTSMSHT